MSRAIVWLVLLALGSPGCSLRSECEVNPQGCPLVVELQGSPVLSQDHPDYFLPLRIKGRMADQPLTFTLTQAATSVDVSLDTVAGDENLYIVHLSPANTPQFQPGWINLIVSQDDRTAEAVALLLTRPIAYNLTASDAAQSGPKISGHRGRQAGRQH